MVEKFKDRFSHLDTIPACDRQTDRRTDTVYDGKDRAMLSVTRGKGFVPLPGRLPNRYEFF